MCINSEGVAKCVRVLSMANAAKGNKKTHHPSVWLACLCACTAVGVNVRFPVNGNF